LINHSKRERGKRAGEDYQEGAVVVMVVVVVDTNPEW